MARYIDKDKLINSLKEDCATLVKERWFDDYVQGYSSAIGDVIAEPTADVQEVKYCKFELVQDGKGVCSNCHRLDGIDKLAKCCRYCGAFIKWEEESNG